MDSLCKEVHGSVLGGKGRDPRAQVESLISLVQDSDCLDQRRCPSVFLCAWREAKLSGEKKLILREIGVGKPKSRWRHVWQYKGERGWMPIRGRCFWQITLHLQGLESRREQGKMGMKSMKIKPWRETRAQSTSALSVSLLAWSLASSLIPSILCLHLWNVWYPRNSYKTLTCSIKVIMIIVMMSN